MEGERIQPRCLTTRPNPMRLQLRNQRLGLFFGILCCTFCLFGSANQTRGQEIPELLEPWKDWVTWGIEHQNCPTLYSSASEPICYWPSSLNLSASGDGGYF